MSRVSVHEKIPLALDLARALNLIVSARKVPSRATVNRLGAGMHVDFMTLDNFSTIQGLKEQWNTPAFSFFYL